jgi:hypothetical protein
MKNYGHADIAVARLPRLLWHGTSSFASVFSADSEGSTMLLCIGKQKELLQLVPEEAMILL